jgi:hypothetical protein
LAWRRWTLRLAVFSNQKGEDGVDQAGGAGGDEGRAEAGGLGQVLAIGFADGTRVMIERLQHLALHARRSMSQVLEK